MYDFIAGGKNYKLRLTTRTSLTLEKMLGGNPLCIFENITGVPPMEKMLAVLFASLQNCHPDTSMDEAYDIFDAYIADGHTQTDFLNVIVEVYQVSGLLPKDVKKKGAEPKN